MARSDLRHEGSSLAETLQALLNQTVADNARVVSLLRDRDTVMVGTNLDRELTTRPVALRSTAARALRQHGWQVNQPQISYPQQRRGNQHPTADPAERR